jgi:hypothetical protein
MPPKLNQGQGQRTITDMFAAPAAAPAAAAPVSSDSDSEDDFGAAGAAAVPHDIDEGAGYCNQMHPKNMNARFMDKVWSESRNRQTEVAPGRGILPETLEARRYSKKLLQEQRILQQQQQQILQQQQLEEQQRQELTQQQLEEQQRQQREAELLDRQHSITNPVFLTGDEVHPNQQHPTNRAIARLNDFMSKSKGNQGGRRYNTKRKSKKSKSKKSKSKRNKMQKKKTRRSRRLVK